MPVKNFYEVIESNIIDERGTEIKVYGVELIGRKYLNVFTDKETAERFVELCNRLEVSPIHIQDVIDDFLNNI